MGLVLFVLRSRPLPLGSFTVLLSVNVALMTIIHDKYPRHGPVSAHRRRRLGRA